MANVFTKSCRNFARFLNAYSYFIVTKGVSTYASSSSLLINPVGYRGRLNVGTKFNNLRTQRVRCEDSKRACLHASGISSGIEEFFPPGVVETGQPLPEEVKSGTRKHKLEINRRNGL